MQKLVFRNGKGTEIDLTSGCYGITEWSGFSADGLNVQSQQVPFQDGAVFLDALMEQRDLSVTLAINDENNLETRYQKRRELIALMNPKLGEGLLIYTNDFISKQIHVIPQLPVFQNKNSNDAGTPKASLSWTACNPYWEDLEETIERVNFGETKTIVNEGDVPTQIEIQEKSARIRNPVIQNLTTDQKVEYQGYITDGLYINTNTGKKEVISEILHYDFQRYSAGNIQSICFSPELNTYVATTPTVNLVRGSYLASKNLTNWKRTLGVSGLLVKWFPSVRKFIAVQSGRSIRISKDGYIWDFPYTITTANVSIQGLDYISEKNLFVATVQGNASNSDSGVVISSDLKNWSYYALGKSFNSCIYDSTNDKFILSGSNGLYKTDVLTTLESAEKNTNVSSVLSAVIVSGNLFVLTASGVSYVSLSDFTAEPSVAFSASGFTKLFYDGGVFVAVGGTNIKTSTNGTSWTNRTNPTSYNLSDVCYNGNTFIIAGENESIISSSDGSSWSLIYEGSTYPEIKDLCYSTEKDLLVAVGVEGNILTSTDSENWTNQTSGVSVDLNEVIWVKEKNLFFAVGAGGTILSSPNAINWTAKTSGTTNDLYGICYSVKENLLVVVGEATGNSTMILTSSDGDTWTSRDVSPTGATARYIPHLRSVCYSEEKEMFMAVGSGEDANAVPRIKSTDGLTWSIYSTTSAVNVRHTKVIYSEYYHLFIIIGTNESTTPAGGNIYVIMTNDGSNTFIPRLYASRLPTADKYWLQDIAENDIHEFFTFSNATGTSPGVLVRSQDSINWLMGDGALTPINTIIFYPKKKEFLIAGAYGVISLIDVTRSNAIQNITSDSDINLKLEIGNNNFTLTSLQGSGYADIKFRQKYIGV